MLTPGTLYYIDPFVFKNGAKPKAKYFIVLAQMDGELMIASLPTSKDHLPVDTNVIRGCVNIPERCISAFVFEAGDIVTNTFSFPQRTFIYGEQVDDYCEEELKPMADDMETIGILNSDLFQELLDCMKQSSVIKRKYKKWL